MEEREGQGQDYHDLPDAFVALSFSLLWFRRRTMSLLECWPGLRVRIPFVYHPHGDTDGLPPLLRPSPPPIG